MYPHTPAFSDSDNVYFMYQMPNWEWNEIGDPSGPDHMNYVYVGFAGEDINFEYGDCPSDVPGDVNEDGGLNVLDIVDMVNYIFGNTNFNDCQLSLGDVNGDGGINISDIVVAINLILSP